MISEIDDQDREFLRRYVGYLRFGCPPPTRYVRAVEDAGDWQDNGMKMTDCPIPALVSLMEYAASEDMRWELHTVTGYQPDYAQDFLQKTRAIS